jgi:hypothetical protein
MGRIILGLLVSLLVVSAWSSKANALDLMAMANPDIPRQEAKVMTFISPEEVQALGWMPIEAIAGFLVGAPPTTETFRPNPRFIEFMHQVIRTSAPFDLDLRAAAREQKNGWVYIIDLRTPEGPQGQVPAEDIIGAFQVRNGEIIPDSYEANDRHHVFSRRGLVSLPPSLRAAFFARLPKVPPSKGDAK